MIGTRIVTGTRRLRCSDRRVERVVRHVTQDLSQRVTGTEAAKIAGLERAYFSKRFHEVFGVSFAAWSACVRVEEAKTLLRVIDMPITAVANAVGYVDVTTFERTFKRSVGVVPREYRRRIKQNAETKTQNAETTPAAAS